MLQSFRVTWQGLWVKSQAGCLAECRENRGEWKEVRLGILLSLVGPGSSLEPSCSLFRSGDGAGHSGCTGT